MRAGTPVPSYDDLDAAKLIVISSPIADLPDIVFGLQDSTVVWRGKSVVLFNSILDSSSLCPLERLGASPGSIHLLEGLERKGCLVEGGDVAVRMIRSLLMDSAGYRVIRMHRGGKWSYLAAASLGNHAFLSLLDAANTALLLAEVDPQDARLILEQMLQTSLRAYFKSGKGAWDADGTPTLKLEREALARHDPALAACYEDMMNAALRWRKARSGAAEVPEVSV